MISLLVVRPGWNDEWYVICQFGALGWILVLGTPLVVLWWAVPIADRKSWAIGRRKIFRVSALMLGFLPLLISLVAVLFRCRDNMTPVPGWKFFPVYALVAVQLVGAGAFVSAARGIRPIAVAAATVALFAAMVVGIMALFFIGGEGP
jgi:hypothetical protein